MPGVEEALDALWHKESGMGKEGPKYAVEEMTDLKMVVYHP